MPEVLRAIAPDARRTSTFRCSCAWSSPPRPGHRGVHLVQAARDLLERRRHRSQRRSWCVSVPIAMVTQVIGDNVARPPRPRVVDSFASGPWSAYGGHRVRDSSPRPLAWRSGRAIRPWPWAASRSSDSPPVVMSRQNHAPHYRIPDRLEALGPGSGTTLERPWTRPWTPM